MLKYKIASQPSDIPTTRHFALVVFDQITIPGDERSRTHPGHGYPESIETVLRYCVFDSEGAMKNWIIENGDKSYRRPYVPLDAKALVVQKSVSINFKE